MNKIKYIAGYKYQLNDEYSITLPFTCPDIDDEFISVRKGVLIISKGYAWDGPSGPTLDTPDFMRGSLVHDAGYQLGRGGLLDESFREKFDSLLREICIEDGMSVIRADVVYTGVREFGGRFFKEQPPEIIEAP